MNVTLPPQFEAMLEEKVTSGRYADASEVIQEALRLLDERDRLQHLRAALAIGLEQIERAKTSNTRRSCWTRSTKLP